MMFGVLVLKACIAGEVGWLVGLNRKPSRADVCFEECGGLARATYPCQTYVLLSEVILEVCANGAWASQKRFSS